MNTNDIIKKYLSSDEILWQGTPVNTPLFNKSDFFLVPFSIIFGGFFIIYALITALMLITGESIIFSLVGITFLLMGAYILFIRLWYRKKRISRQVYFVTDKRVFAFDTMRDNVIFDIALENTVLFLGDKSLILGESNAIGDFIYNMGLDIFFRKFSHETPAFKYIDDIDNVSKIIITNKEKAADDNDDSLFI